MNINQGQLICFIVSFFTFSVLCFLSAHQRFYTFRRMHIYKSTYLLTWLDVVRSVVSTDRCIVKRFKSKSTNLAHGQFIMISRPPMNIRSKGQRSRSQGHKVHNGARDSHAEPSRCSCVVAGLSYSRRSSAWQMSVMLYRVPSLQLRYYKIRRFC